MKLSLVMVTQADVFALPFLRHFEAAAHALGAELVIGADRWHPPIISSAKVVPLLKTARFVHVESKGYIESVLDSVLEHCTGNYILRVDDDERISPAMMRWLRDESYLAHDHWKFPRVHFWGDTQTVMMTPHLYPDHQTRLSVRAKAGGRGAVHQGSPYGGGVEAPVVLEHHKFLVKSAEERLEVAARYDAFSAGYGTGMMAPFSLPERSYKSFEVAAYQDGRSQVGVPTRTVQLD